MSLTIPPPPATVRLLQVRIELDEEEDDEGFNERDVRLDQVLQEVGDEFYYAYDFGDG